MKSKFPTVGSFKAMGSCCSKPGMSEMTQIEYMELNEAQIEQPISTLLIGFDDLMLKHHYKLNDQDEFYNSLKKHPNHVKQFDYKGHHFVLPAKRNWLKHLHFFDSVYGIMYVIDLSSIILLSPSKFHLVISKFIVMDMPKELISLIGSFIDVNSMIDRTTIRKQLNLFGEILFHSSFEGEGLAKLLLFHINDEFIKCNLQTILTECIKFNGFRDKERPWKLCQMEDITMDIIKPMSAGDIDMVLDACIAFQDNVYSRWYRECVAFDEE